uniref:GDNF family receptor alpha 2 n=1 Tax=Pseudonaja textilis TaxID=8673 RepID=A0A670Z6J7_PSETE
GQGFGQAIPPVLLVGRDDAVGSPMDCVRANVLCASEPGCSSSFRTLRQCLAGRDHNTLLGNKECRLALEVLQGSALHGCRCRRRMKRELPCLQIYWSLHLGEELYEASPYEPLRSPPPDAFRLASIVSGTLGKEWEQLNPCLEAAKACNLNNNCKKLRSAYISTCNKEVSASEHCSQRRCRKALRHFFDQVPSAYSYRLLFCPCKDQACAERRRQTIVPDCSYQEREKPNCLTLRSQCRAEPLCRSRLADFHTNCQAFLTSCSRDNYQACLDSYTGLIGLDLTPNYVDASFSNPLISLWCSCQGSGNMEEECEKFLKDFTENACLRKLPLDPGAHWKQRFPQVGGGAGGVRHSRSFCGSATAPWLGEEGPSPNAPSEAGTSSWGCRCPACSQPWPPGSSLGGGWQIRWQKSSGRLWKAQSSAPQCPPQGRMAFRGPWAGVGLSAWARGASGGRNKARSGLVCREALSQLPPLPPPPPPPRKCHPGLWQRH